MKERTRFEREIRALAGINNLGAGTQLALIERAASDNELDFLVPPEREIDPTLGQTLYLPVQLNKTVPPQVGVFLPRSFQPTTAMDLIVYFHGHIIPDCKTDKHKFLAKGMEYYWNTPLFTCLREDLVASGQSAILIAPTFIPIFANKSNSPRDYGNLNEAGKFDFLINETLAQLTKKGTLPANAQIGRIILSGHSGGGLPMQGILNAKNALTPNVVECWGFECLYFGTSIWEKWLKANPGKTFRHYRRPNRFGTPTKALEKHRNFIDVKDGTDHCRIVKEKWRQALDSSRAGQSSGQLAPPSSSTSPPVKPPPAPSSPALSTPSTDKFTLTEWKLATGKIAVASAGDKKKGTLVSITEAPAIFLPEIIGMARDRALNDKKTALADKLDAATWFKQFTRLTFLGRPLKSGQYLHLEMAKLLKAIEGEMVKQYGGDAKSVGDMLLHNSTEGLAASRLTSSTATFSMHMFGLAVDVNYLGNPYIEPKYDIKALNNVLKNATQLLNKPTLVYQSGYAKDKFDSVQQLDAMLEKYFSLLDAPTELEQVLKASTSSDWRGLSLKQAQTKIQKNLDDLARSLARVGKVKGYFKKDEILDKKEYFKKHGILDFDKRFVVQMEALGLNWGGHYGDMMHFDMRTTGVGAYIEKARLAYAKKVKDLARKYFNEKNYGTHSPA
jgi:hypothetical protein